MSSFQNQTYVVDAHSELMVDPGLNEFLPKPTDSRMLIPASLVFPHAEESIHEILVRLMRLFIPLLAQGLGFGVCSAQQD